jgi:hypothetical protein
VATKTVTTREYDPKQVFKDSMLSALSFGTSGGDGKVEVSRVVETRAKIFDGFMRLDENYETVPPARCIRIASFSPITPVPRPEGGGGTINLDPVGDFFHNDAGQKESWLSYAVLLGYTRTNQGLVEMMTNFFQMALIAEWDAIWYRNVAPRIYNRIMALLRCTLTTFDVSSLNTYDGPGERAVRASFEADVTRTRADVTEITFLAESAAARALSKSLMVFRFRSIRVHYSTAHYNGILFSGALTGDILDETGSTIRCPPTAAEKRNPRREDRFLAQKLVTHLNRNLEYYNRVIWTTMDAQRRYLLLDGFKIETFVSRLLSPFPPLSSRSP